MSEATGRGAAPAGPYEDGALARSLRRRLRQDRWATGVVVLSGFSIIFVILAIFFVIASEVFPLFSPPRLERLEDARLHLAAPPLAFGVDEYREQLYVVTRKGLRFHSLKGAPHDAPIALPGLGEASIVAVSASAGGFLVASLSDGRALPIQVEFEVEYDGDRRSVTGGVSVQKPLSWNASPVTLLAHKKTERGFSLAGITGGREVTLIKVERRKTLMGTTIEKEHREVFRLPNQGRITALTWGDSPERLYAGTASGQIIGINPESGDDVPQIEVLGALAGRARPIAVLGFLKGGMTLVAGSESGSITSFHFVRDDAGRYRMQKVHEFEAHASRPVFFSPGHRNKAFLTLDASGVLKSHYGTTGKTRFELQADGGEAPRQAILSPKDDGLLMLDGKGGLVQWNVRDPHPEVSWDTLFGKVKYEGYSKADYIWQSTGGTDDFESKFSLTPLLFGTLKGTLYALMFAGPLALMAAFYTAQFMNPALSGVVKPTVEFMAAIPSVVLGFFGALWLAPRLEALLPSLVLAPVLLIGGVWAYQRLRVRWAADPYAEKNSVNDFLGLLFVVTAGCAASWLLGPVLEGRFLGGDYQSWLNNLWQVQVDQRNSLVVGLAMGFAVVPNIFTIAEDSLSNVPRHLSGASLALGATPWQTAVQVVLPAAIPGIFSGIMIGFGRAVGETMIVLMATGNTPIMDWSAFNGFRALSANIAVELPEAPEGDTLFRILFLSALLLFMITFVFNSLAEWVRLRLRRRYELI